MKAGNAWRLQGGTYCTYNAFARVDVRIVVALPGSIEAYCTTQSGERLAIDDLGWKETYVSSVLRALRAPDDLARSTTVIRLHTNYDNSFVSDSLIFFQFALMHCASLTHFRAPRQSESFCKLSKSCTLRAL